MNLPPRTCATASGGVPCPTRLAAPSLAHVTRSAPSTSARQASCAENAFYDTHAPGPKDLGPGLQDVERGGCGRAEAGGSEHARRRPGWRDDAIVPCGAGHGAATSIITVLPHGSGWRP